MADSTNVDEKKHRRPTLWCFAPSLTPESVDAGMSKIDCEQLDRAWRAFCGLAEMFDVARHQLNTALENHTSEAQGPLILGDTGSGKSQIIHQLLRQEGAGVVPWTPVIEADVTLMSAERFLYELYFGFWTLFTPPEEDWEGVKDLFSTQE